uniref:Uncharacterized protein n=1 Tax=Acrobeloides nanus TaxID=290746 RepID=A0A914CVQ4_9BILA
MQPTEQKCIRRAQKRAFALLAMGTGMSCTNLQDFIKSFCPSSSTTIDLLIQHMNATDVKTAFDAVNQKYTQTEGVGLNTKLPIDFCPIVMFNNAKFFSLNLEDFYDDIKYDGTIMLNLLWNILKFTIPIPFYYIVPQS